MSRPTVVLLGALLAAGGGCSREPRLAPAPDVILIVVDTLRADHLGCYGYDLDTSPHIDVFAAGGTRYENCVAPAPWTLPSHASLFTGLYPHEHRAYSFIPSELTPRNAFPLADSHTTLAEAFRAAGYETRAFVANEAYCSAWTGLAQGFDSYEVKHMYAEEMLPRIFAALAQPRARPLFLFLNFMDTHTPYNVKPRPGLLPRPVAGDPFGVAQRLAAATLPGAADPPAELAQTSLDQYDTSIANVDEQLGKLFARLRALGRFDSALLVLTSDHGEFFGEHRLVGHSKDVYEPAVDIPLIVKPPASAARRPRVNSKRVSLASLPALLRKILANTRAKDALRGFPGPPARILTENRYSRAKDLIGKPWSARFRRERMAIYDGPFKFIWSSDGRHELYDLQADPRERTNLCAARPEVAARLRGQIKSIRSGHPASRPVGQPPASSADELRILQALGYADSASQPAEQRP